MTLDHFFNALQRSFAVLACTVASVFAASAVLAATPQPTEDAPRREASPMKIQLSANGAIIATVTLDANESARDFAALLPLSLKLRDYASTEKIADLPRALSTKGAPAAYQPLVGDISFFAPWGNLAIFYKDGPFSSGLVRLGRVDAGLDALRQTIGAVRIERVQP